MHRAAPASTAASAPEQMATKTNATRTVYIGLRVRCAGGRNQRIKTCRGLTLRAFDFTPEEVHRIILRALEAEAEKVQRVARAKAR